MKLFRQDKRHNGGSSSEGGGFTLIEVVLVLAIGGLIFLLAFLAFGQATKNRRDTQRRSDAARVVSEAQNYKGDNNGYPADVTTAAAAGGAIDPAGAKTFVNSYLGGAAFKDPSSSTGYVFDVPSVDPAKTPVQGHMMYLNGKKCGTGTSVPETNTGGFAVIVGLEKGTACRDDQ